MFRRIILYAIALALLTGLLKWMEYRFFISDHATEIYIGLIALVFTGLGIWAGWKLTRQKPEKEIVFIEKEILVPATGNFSPDENRIKSLGISEREMEVLKLVAEGLSNQEIADKLFVSANTVKTHTSNLFLKLEVNRRTQAVQKAKSLGLIN